MKLLRKQIPGNTFVSVAVSGNFPYQFSETDVAGWDDITSIDNIHEFGERAADYMRATKEMAVLFEAKTGADEAAKWANCTSNEKICLSKRHIVHSKALRLEVLTSDQDKESFLSHAKNSIDCRKARTEAATVSIGYEIAAVVDRIDLVNDVMEKIERFVNSNDPDLKNWMKSIGPYVGGGLQAKSYYNSTIDTLYNEIMENGEY